MKIKFIENCTVYPGGVRDDVFVDQEREFDDEYAQLLVNKGHAVEVNASKGKKAAAADQNGDVA